MDVAPTANQDPPKLEVIKINPEKKLAIPKNIFMSLLTGASSNVINDRTRHAPKNTPVLFQLPIGVCVIKLKIPNERKLGPINILRNIKVPNKTAAARNVKYE